MDTRTSQLVNEFLRSADASKARRAQPLWGGNPLVPVRQAGGDVGAEPGSVYVWEPGDGTFGGAQYGGHRIGGGGNVAPVGRNDPVGTGGPDIYEEAKKWATAPRGRPNADRESQTGPEYMLRKAGDTYFDWATGASQKRQMDREAAGGAAAWKKITGVIEPVTTDLSNWWTQSGHDYEAGRAARRSQLTASVKAPAAQFSPTGERGGDAFAGTPEGQFILARESGGNYNAKNPNSSASGAYQFIDSTWLWMVKKHGPPEMANAIQQDKSGKLYIPDANARKAIMGLKTDPTFSGQMGQALSTDVTAAMSKDLGRKPTLDELYLGWHFGSSTGSTLAKLGPDVSVGAFIDKDAIRSNPRIFPQGAATTVATMRQALRADGSGNQAGGGGRMLAGQNIALPGAPPQQEAPIPVDFSRAEALLSSMRPSGPDEAYTKKQRGNLLLSGLMSGVAEGGTIPQMLARMAAGGFQAKAQGEELSHNQQELSRKEMLDWQKTGYNFELTKAEQRANEAAGGQKVSFQNRSGAWDYKLKLAELSKLDMDSMGVMHVRHPSADGMSMQESMIDVGSDIAAFRLASGLGSGGLGGSRSGGGLGLPNRVQDSMEMYRYAQQRTAAGAPGGDAYFYGAFADEIANSPYKGDIIGGDSKRYQAEISKMVAMGMKPEAAEVNYITKLLSEGARANPAQMQQLMNRAAGYGLLGPLMMRQ